jgi:hypothetical protein
VGREVVGGRAVGRTALLYQERAREMGVERVILDELYPRQILHTGRKKNPPPKHKHIKIK